AARQVLGLHGHRAIEPIAPIDAKLVEGGPALAQDRARRLDGRLVKDDGKKVRLRRADPQGVEVARAAPTGALMHRKTAGAVLRDGERAGGVTVELREGIGAIPAIVEGG